MHPYQQSRLRSQVCYPEDSHNRCEGKGNPPDRSTVPAPDLPSSQRWTCSGWSFRRLPAQYQDLPFSSNGLSRQPAVRIHRLFCGPSARGRPSRFQGTRGGCYGGLDSRGNAVSHCKEYRRKYCSIPADF